MKEGGTLNKGGRGDIASEGKKKTAPERQTQIRDRSAVTPEREGGVSGGEKDLLSGKGKSRICGPSLRIPYLDRTRRTFHPKGERHLWCWLEPRTFERKRRGLSRAREKKPLRRGKKSTRTLLQQPRAELRRLNYRYAQGEILDDGEKRLEKRV